MHFCKSLFRSIARTDLDITYITSRIIVMPFPSEGLESAYRTNHAEDVKMFLETRHPNSKYSVYNLSGRTYHSKFGQARVIDCGFAYPDNFKAPLLNSLYQLCEDMYQYLAGDTRNVCVIHCMVSCLVKLCNLVDIFKILCRMGNRHLLPFYVLCCYMRTFSRFRRMLCNYLP